MKYDIDGIIFIVSNIFLLIYVLRQKKLTFKEKIFYFILFLILNSSYNIMIKRVHDFNLIIPRTLIYRHKIFGPFTILDFICIFIVLKNIPYLLSILKKEKIISLCFIKDIIIYIISTISFLIMQGYWLDGGSSFFSASKGFVYSLAILVVTFKYLRKNINLIWPIIIILSNGFISTLLIDNSALWVRYGHVVSIIDQEDAYTISLFLIILLFVLSIKTKNKNYFLNLPYFVLFLIFLFQNLNCVYKTNFILIPLMLILYFFITNKNVLFAFITFLIPTGIIVFFEEIYTLFTSLAIQTRMVQIVDFTNYMSEKGFFRYVFGLGLGTPYYSAKETGDLGEIKISDVKNTLAKNYRINVQTPIISTFKNAGLVGTIVLIIFIVVLWKKILRIIQNLYNKFQNIDRYILCETIAFGIFTCVIMLNNYTFFGGTLPIVIFNTFCLSKFLINSKKICDGDLNENIAN